MPETRANPAFAEARYNLGNLLDDQGRSEAAVECLRKALLVAPDYIDASVKPAALSASTSLLASSAEMAGTMWTRPLNR
jgi:tetratricopeptide (TPR) repeat protein